MRNRVPELKEALAHLSTAVKCEECGEMFTPRTMHKRKYCSHLCGHRARVRASRARQLGKVKGKVAERRYVSEEGDIPF